MTILQERGFFWYSNEIIPAGQTMPYSAVTGELKIGENGEIDIQLDAPLHTDSTPKTITISAGKDYEIQDKALRGLLNNNKNVFLYGLSGDGTFRKHFFVRDCFIGKKPIPDTNDILYFNKIGINLKGFEGWFCFSNLEYTDSEEELSLTYKKKEDIVYHLENATITIRCGLDCSISTDASFKQSAYLTYEAKEPLTLEIMRKKFSLIEDFFILLTNSEYRMEWATVFLTNGAEYKHYFLRSKNFAPPTEWYNCWTNFIMLRDNFGELFRAWELKNSIFGSGFYLYLATRRGQPSYIENRFLDLMMGLESFHRRKNPKSIDSTAYNMREKIVNQIEDESDKKWVMEQLQYIHEPRAGKRLKETLQSIPITIGKSKIKDFSYQCTTIRNNMIHSNTCEEQAKPNEFLIDLDKKNDALTYLYHFLLLAEIGISGETLDNILRNGFSSFGIKRIFTEVGLLKPEAKPPSAY